MLWRTFIRERLARSKIDFSGLRKLERTGRKRRISGRKKGELHRLVRESLEIPKCAVPGELVRQLKPGGRIVLPLGSDWDQYLVVVGKAANGTVSRRDVLPVRFVPLTGDH